MLTTKRDYGIRSHGIWYDFRLRKEVNEKGKNTIYFPSKGEYECFLMLDQHLPESDIGIYPHARIRTSSIDWVLDFKLESFTSKGSKSLAKLCNSINGSSYGSLDAAFIEYKGFADSNFRMKIRRLYIDTPSLNKQVIICAKTGGLYKFKEGNKKIISIKGLRESINVLF